MRAGYGPADDDESPEYFVGDLDEIRIWREPQGETAIFDYAATRIVDELTRHRLFGYFPLEQTGSVATASNEAKEEIEYRCTGDPEGGFSGFGGGGSDLPAGTFVGFNFATSPWIEPGAF